MDAEEGGALEAARAPLVQDSDPQSPGSPFSRLLTTTSRAEDDLYPHRIPIVSPPLETYLGLSHCVRESNLYIHNNLPERVFHAPHQNGHHPTKLWHRFCTSVACKMSLSTCSATGRRGPKSSPFSLAWTRAMTASARSFRAPFGRSAPSAAPKARTRSDSLADR